MLTKTVLGKTFLNQSSGIHLYTHSCELTSLVERKAAPIFLKLSLMAKFEVFASFAALAIGVSRKLRPRKLRPQTSDLENSDPPILEFALYENESTDWHL